MLNFHKPHYSFIVTPIDSVTIAMAFTSQNNTDAKIFKIASFNVVTTLKVYVFLQNLPKKQRILPKELLYLRVYDYICNVLSKEAQDILLNSLTNHHQEKRANSHYWDCPVTGADFPYLRVVCGEP